MKMDGVEENDELVLTQDQEEHKNRILYIWKFLAFCFDMSMLGCGKTYVGAALSLFFKYCIVICPANAVPKWENIKEKYKLKNIVCIMSYDALRSVKDKQPKHGFLFRFDIENNTEFRPTEKYMKLVKNGLLLIIDECHKLKNTSAQHYAIKALMKPICTEKTKSKALIISGSPFDEIDCAINFLRMTHIIRHRMLKIYHKDRGELELYGAQELIDFAREVDPDTTNIFLQNVKITNKNVEYMCYRMFQDIIKSKSTSVMPIRHSERFSDIFDGYYNLPGEDQKMLMDAIQNLGRLVRYDPRTKTVNFDSKPVALGAITKCLMVIEAAKVPTFARLAYEALEADPNVRVVVAVNYRASISELKRIFTVLGYDFLIIEGSVSKEKRDEIVGRFQNKDGKMRLLFANIQTVAESIDLDDKYGDQPRKVFISPNYGIIKLFQFTARFARMNSKSTASIRFVYGKCGMSHENFDTVYLDRVQETSILNALARKSKVLEETLTEHVNAGIKFPGSYESKCEEDYPGFPPGQYPTFTLFKVEIEKFMKSEKTLEEEMEDMEL